MKASLDRPKILIVEDEQIVAMDLQRTLTQLGYEVVGMADRASEAVRLAETTCPDLALIDIQLRGEMDGVEAARQIQERCQIPAVFLTANANESTLDRAKRVLPFGYLTKPFRSNELNATVAVALHQHRLASELQRSNQELTRFSYAVSHDLKAPVRTVRSLAELLERRTQGQMDQENTQMLSMMIQAADGMQRLIDSLLQYAQAAEGQLRAEFVSVETVVNRMLVTLALEIEKAKAKVACGPLPTVHADRIQLEQVFQNLVANAIQYRRPEESPVIDISSEPIENGWQFAVRDNGEGIPSHLQERIFEPLKRLHGNEAPGSGLGLALCRVIVERHGGRMWVESSGAGRGSTFRFTLRASQTEKPGR